MNIRAANLDFLNAPEVRRGLPFWLGAAAMLLALALLYGFYHVTQQAVARAHTHWERAPAARAAAVDMCLPSAADCLRLR